MSGELTPDAVEGSGGVLGGLCAGDDGRVADGLPSDGGEHVGKSVDAVVSSFVLQLVPERPPVYREIRRVLRPGGRLAFVTWCVEESPFAPSEAFEDVLDELKIPVDEDPEEKVAGDFVSSGAAGASRPMSRLAMRWDARVRGRERRQLRPRAHRRRHRDDPPVRTFGAGAAGGARAPRTLVQGG